MRFCRLLLPAFVLIFAVSCHTVVDNPDMNLSGKGTDDISDPQFENIPATEENNRQFEICIRQNGVNIEIRNNEVTLAKREFDIVFSFSHSMRVLVNGSLIPEIYNNAEQMIVDLDFLKSRIYARPGYDSRNDLFLSDDEFINNWYYNNGGDHDFGEFEINAGRITALRTIKRFTNVGETSKSIRVSDISDPVYLVFLAVSRENRDQEVELQRQYIKINWRSSEDDSTEARASIGERKTAPNQNKEKFELSIRQNGVNADIRNNEVTIENKEFDIVLNLSGPIGIAVEGYFHPGRYAAAERGEVLTDLLKSRLGARVSFGSFARLPNDHTTEGIKLGDDYWYYRSEDDNRFSKIESNTGGITATRPVVRFDDRNGSGTYISVSEATVPLYLVFFTYARGEDWNDIAEIQRQYIKINWLSSESRTAEIEALINGNEDILALDIMMNESYRVALDAVANQPDKNSLYGEQQNWIIYTRNSCLDKECLEQVYRERINILSENDYMYKPLLAEIVFEGHFYRFYRDVNSHVMSFNQAFSYRKNEKVLYCERFVDGPYEVAGGICMIDDSGERTKVKICNSNMTDAHKMEPVGLEGLSDDELVEFTVKNCSGG